jgi:DNA-binding beta-propeller fold protein YncE
MAVRNIALSLTLALACGFTWGQNPPLRLDRTIPLPGVEGRIDHLSADIQGGRVFISALGNGTVEVADVSRGQRLGQIRGLREPQGVLYVPRHHMLYVGTGEDGMVRSYDAKSLAPVGSISLGDDADNLRYDRQNDKVVVGYGSGAIAFLSPDLSGKSEVRLPVHPESFQFTSDGAHLLVNLPEDQSIALIDVPRLKVMSKWTHLGALANFPMAVDNQAGRFFVACRRPAQLLELSERNGSVIQHQASVGDADDLFFDAARKRIYVIGGEGFVDVVDAPANGKLKSIQHVPTAAGARTGLFVPAWNKLLVAAPHRGSEQARLLVYALP